MLVSCPDCGTQVSDLANQCPKCHHPNPGKSASDKNIKEVVDNALNKPKSDYSWLWGLGVVIGVIFIYRVLTYNPIEIIKIEHEESFLGFGIPTVYVTLYNDGSASRYNYKVYKEGSEYEIECQGQAFLKREERQTISFKCNGLAGYAGKYFVKVWRA